MTYSVVFVGVTLFCLFLDFSFAESSSTTSSAALGDCVIPNQSPKYGKCTPTHDCAVYLKLRSSIALTLPVISFMRQIQCQNKPGLICCPMNGSYQNATVAIDSSKIKVRSMYESPTQPQLTNRFGEAGDIPPTMNGSLMDNINEEECGIFTDQRIIGGEIAGLEEYPWTALLIYNSSFQYGCSGAIINKRYILTAAHCVTGTTITAKGNLIRVRLGEYDTQGDPDCIQEVDGYDCAPAVKEYEIEKTIVHPYYEEMSISQHHDIALIKTRRRIEYSTFIQPLCVPTKFLSAGVVPGKHMTLAGWGATDRFQKRLGNILSPIKLFTKVPIVNQTKCQGTFSNSRLVLGTGQLCAGGEKDNDSCPGDSGGPLMYFNHEESRFVVAGIVSLGKSEEGKIACGAEGFPGVYTRTDQYTDWIQNAMKHN